LSWSRAQGAFVGASLDGSVVKPDKSRNEDVYGKGKNAKNILLDHSVRSAGGSGRSSIRSIRVRTEAKALGIQRAVRVERPGPPFVFHGGAKNAESRRADHL
jgi:hypothetical protein